MKESKKECKSVYFTNENLFFSLLIYLDIAQLRKKFEEDKKRIDVLKANRKFKPF